MKRPIFSGWCVIVKSRNGCWWSHPAWSGRTRAQAIAKYCDGFDSVWYAQERPRYAKDVRRGHAKCVRFNAFEATP